MIERHSDSPIPHALDFRREECLVQAVQAHPRAGRGPCRDAEFDDAAFVRRVARHDAQLDVAAHQRQLRAVDRLGGVLQQVQQHLLDQDRVDQQRRQRCAT
jgi:hypothetical protein